MADERPEGNAARGRIPWPVAAVGAALVVAALGILLFGRDRQPPAKVWDRPLEPVAMVNTAKGTVKAVRGDERRALAPGETVYVGEGIETGGRASTAVRTYPMDAIVELGAETTVLFETAAEVRIQNGQVRADLGRAVTAFITPQGRVLGMGTSFTVAVAPKGTEISVEKGWVRVDGPGAHPPRVDAGGRVLLSPQPTAQAR